MNESVKVEEKLSNFFVGKNLNSRVDNKLKLDGIRDSGNIFMRENEKFLRIRI